MSCCYQWAVTLPGGLAMTGFAANLLDRFSTAANAVRKQPPVDQRLVPAMILAMVALAAEALYIAVSDLSFPFGFVLRMFGLLAFILGGGMIARRYGMRRIGDALQAAALAPILGALSVVAMVILTRFTTTFADDALAGADHVLGLDWMAMFAVFQRNPGLLELARVAYLSFYWQFIAASLVLFCLDRPAAGFRFINAWAIALLISVAIYPFYTAVGPYLRYGIVPADIPNLHRDAPWTTGPIIEAIREGRRTDVIGSMTGLIFFPSFHAAGAILYLRAWWQFKWLRWLVVPLNLGLIAAAPVFGLHYFIDLVGGVAVAVVAIVLANALTTRIERRVGANG